MRDDVPGREMDFRMNERSLTLRAALSPALLVALSACARADTGTGLSGAVQVDGSSTVAPVSEAVAEEFQIANPGVRVTVGISGTGGGFQRFCAGETDVSDASRPISEGEARTCASAGIEYLELPVAWDGLSVVVNPRNEFVRCLTVDEIRRIWEPDSRVSTWRDVRPEFPDQPIKLYGPGTDSGTFDYFTETVMGEVGASRPDYQASEDDNVLVQGVSGDEYALAYFGYAYVRENADKLQTVGVDGGAGCVLPSAETILSGAYAPLSRPLSVYVARGALARPAVAEFVRFYMEYADVLVPSTGYLALAREQYEQNLHAISTGSGQ